MKGKVAVITGSTRGIGKAIAERMAEHGAKVVISSRKQDVCDAVTKEINDKSARARRSRLPPTFPARRICRTWSTNPTAPSSRSTCWSATPTFNHIRSARRHLRRPVPQDPGQQHRRQQLADLDGGPADDRAQGRLDRDRVLDRRPQGFDRARRLCDLEGPPTAMEELLTVPA